MLPGALIIQQKKQQQQQKHPQISFYIVTIGFEGSLSFFGIFTKSRLLVWKILSPTAMTLNTI